MISKMYRVEIRIGYQGNWVLRVRVRTCEGRSGNETGKGLFLKGQASVLKVGTFYESSKHFTKISS